MAKQPYLSVIIPAYNEAERITPTLFEVDKYLSEQEYTFEILVVDDGSKDKTKEIVEKLSQGPIKILRVEGFEENRGKGAAVSHGMLESRGEVRLFMDADNSTSIEEIEKLLPYLKKGFRVVIGSRALPTSEIPVAQPFYKILSGRLGNIFTRILVLRKIRDTQCGFKLFTQKAAEKIFSRTMISGAIFDVEVLVITKLCGYRIKEVGIKWVNDFDSRFGWRSYIQSLKDTFKIKWNLWRGKYNQKED